MGLLLLSLFVAIPLLEVWLLITVGGWIGAGWTVAAVVLTAIIGATLVRAQGLGVMRRLQTEMAAGGFPVDSVFDGACLLVAGALLLTPGFFTDAVGLALLVPLFRRVLQAWLLARAAHIDVHTVHTVHDPHARPTTVIDGDFTEIRDGDDKRP